jgi:hypothetical protein
MEWFAVLCVPFHGSSKPLEMSFTWGLILISALIYWKKKEFADENTGEPVFLII